jgi:hypothetical protein
MAQFDYWEMSNDSKAFKHIMIEFAYHMQFISIILHVLNGKLSEE